MLKRFKIHLKTSQNQNDSQRVDSTKAKVSVGQTVAASYVIVIICAARHATVLKSRNGSHASFELHRNVLIFRPVLGS